MKLTSSTRFLLGSLSILLLAGLLVVFFPHGARGEVVQAGQSFTCTPTRVWDGDGPIWCAEGPRIRLAGVAARETDGSCRPNHPCPAASADQARNALASLVGRVTGRSREGHLLVRGPAMRCVSDGGAGGSRTAAWCSLSDGRDLSCAMVATRTVARWPQFDRRARLVRC